MFQHSGFNILFQCFLIFFLMCTDRNHRKIWRERQKTVPNFLKMRIFWEKLANNSPILTKIISFWEKFGTLFCLFLMIFLLFLSVYSLVGSSCHSILRVSCSKLSFPYSGLYDTVALSTLQEITDIANMRSIATLWEINIIK